MSRATTATIHLQALRHNLAQLRARAPSARVMAVVKADGYGHGLERVASALRDADGFGVASLADAQRLRAAGLSQPVLLLSGIDAPSDLAALRWLEVDAAIHHPSQLAMLEADAEQGGPPVRCWLKLDTGMHRLGFAPEQARALHARLRALPNVAPEVGLMTHFAASDVFDGEATAAQIRAFQSATEGLEGPRTLCNSAGVLGWPQAHADWIRPGGALYGISVVEGTTGRDFDLQPAMTLSSRLIAVNRVRAGERVGYSASWQCPEDMPVGVVALGYGDGYPRHAPSGTPILVDGVRVPLVGRVSMDLLTVDLRGAPDARVGDPVVAWGRGLPVEVIAAHAGTIGYELVCAITRRVQVVEA